MINLFLKLFQSTLWTLHCNVLKPLERYIVYWKFSITKSSRWVSNYWKFITANILLWRHWHYFSFKINNSHAVASIPLLVRHQFQNTNVFFSHSIIFTGEFQGWCCRTTWWSCWINLGSHWVSSVIELQPRLLSQCVNLPPHIYWGLQGPECRDKYWQFFQKQVQRQRTPKWSTCSPINESRMHLPIKYTKYDVVIDDFVFFSC